MTQEETIRTLERLLAHYESLMQEWSIRNGEPGSARVQNVPLGYQSEARALRAAIDAVREPPHASAKRAAPPATGDVPKARG